MYSGLLAAWREVKSMVLALLGLTALGLWLRRGWLALLSSSLLGGVIYFFRNPERVPASVSPDLIVAAADGRVTAIDLVDDPLFFKGPARRISVFLSLFDVHVQYCPYQGQVKFLQYEAGGFAPAFLKDTSHNEFNLLGLSTPHGPLAVKQIAGLIARRIVCWPTLNDTLDRGQRFGLIKFGSRVDILLPPDVEILAYVGQQVHGGQTIVGRWRT